MADLQFETNPDEFGRPPVASSGLDISGKLVGWGLVSSRQEANYVLIAIGILAIIVTFFFMRSGGDESTVAPPLYVDESAITY